MNLNSPVVLHYSNSTVSDVLSITKKSNETGKNSNNKYINKNTININKDRQ